MCLLIVKPKGRHLQRDWIINGAEANPHGNGAAWVEKKGMRYLKAVSTVEPFADLVMECISDRPAIIHFRLATHGLKDDANCHPFPLIHGWMMAHNGIISGLEHPSKSDTAIYAEIITWRLNQDPNYLDRKESLLEMEMECAGSKLGFLHESGRHLIVNEHLGTWEDGVWFSNNGHKPVSYTGWYDQSGWSSWRTAWDRQRGWPDGKDSKEIGAHDPYERDPLCDDCGAELRESGGGYIGENCELFCRDCHAWNQIHSEL